VVLDRASSGHRHQEGQCGSVLVPAGELKKRCAIHKCEHRGWEKGQQNGKGRRSFFPPPELTFVCLLFSSRIFQSLPILKSVQVPLHGVSATHEVLAHVVSPVCLLRAQWLEGGSDVPITAACGWALAVWANSWAGEKGREAKGQQGLVQRTGQWEAVLLLLGRAESLECR